MKYIVLDFDGHVELFSEVVNHRDVANGRKVRSAGFCSIETFRDDSGNKKTKVKVYGESKTLKAETNGSDAQLIKEAINFSIT